MKKTFNRLVKAPLLIAYGASLECAGREIAAELQTYHVLRRNCQTLCSKLLVKLLCQDRSHQHDFYLVSEAITDSGLSEKLQEDMLYFTMVHSNAYIGSGFAIVSALFDVPWLGPMVFMVTCYYLIKWLIFKPFKTLLGFVGILVAYNVFVLYGPTGYDG